MLPGARWPRTDLSLADQWRLMKMMLEVTQDVGEARSDIRYRNNNVLTRHHENLYNQERLCSL